MKTRKQIEQQLKDANKELERMGKAPLGSGGWSRQKGYVEALEWVLNLE